MGEEDEQMFVTGMVLVFDLKGSPNNDHYI